MTMWRTNRDIRRICQDNEAHRVSSTHQARIIEEVAPDEFDPLPDEWVYLVTKYEDYYQRLLEEDNK